MARTWGARRLGAVFAAVAVMGSIAACGPDLTKENFKPTVVAPKPGSGAEEKAPTGPINEPALKPDKLRTVDTCKLMTSALKGIAAPTGQPFTDENNECTQPVTDSSNHKVTLSVTVDDGLSTIGDDATAGLEGLPMKESTYDSTCSIEVGTSQAPDLGIRTSATVDNGLAPCPVGRKVTAKMIQGLKNNPPKVRVAKGSLLNVDPCKAIDNKVLKNLKVDAANKQEAGLHTCQINSSGPTISLDFKFGYDTTGEGKATQLTPDVKAYVDSRIESSCDIAWKHKKVDEEHTESVSLNYSQYIDSPGEKTLCKNATTLAKSLLSKLPKP